MVAWLLVAFVAFAVAEWFHHQYEVGREYEELVRTGRMRDEM